MTGNPEAITDVGITVLRTVAERKYLVNALAREVGHPDQDVFSGLPGVDRASEMQPARDTYPADQMKSAIRKKEWFDNDAFWRELDRDECGPNAERLIAIGHKPGRRTSKRDSRQPAG